MKGSFLRTIFILFIIAIVGWAIYTKFYKKNSIEQVSEFNISKSNPNESIISNSIRIGIMELDNMNPILSNNKNVQDISRLIFDPLFTLTEDYKIQPALATEYSQIDETTYLIKLRENVKWHDGKEFDAFDVIFTIDMLKEEENHSIYARNVDKITEIEDIDEYTLKIKIKEPTPYFEYNLIFPIVSCKYFNVDNFRWESKNIKPVGTGLYYISDASNDNILLKRNVSGWEKKSIQIETINLIIYDSLSNTINGFKTGEIDLFTTSNRKIEEYLKNITYEKQTYINRNYDYLILNCESVILENKEVRQAINSAIDKDSIVNDIYNAQYKISNFPLDFGSYVYNKNNAIMLYDQNTAKRLLMDAGWKYTAKKWRKIVNYHYRTIDLNILVNKENGNLVKVSNKIKEQLESVGIGVKINAVDTNKFENNLYKGNYDIAIISNNYSYSPSLNKFFKENNLAKFKNEQVSEFINKMEKINDENELKQIVTNIIDIYNDEVPYISLYYNTNTFIYSPHLKGNIKPNSYNLFYGIENWYREY